MYFIFACACFQVLDEADRLLNEDFEKVLDDILSAIPRERKTYLYSATMTNKVRTCCTQTALKNISCLQALELIFCLICGYHS